jgi:hypothetical protein
MLALLYNPAASTSDAREPVASSSSGTIGIQLLEGPADREDDPRAHTYIVDFLAPGTVIHRKFQVANTSQTTQHLDLYAGAATIGGGSFKFAPDRTPNELTSWVTLDPTSRDIPPGGTAPVEATITVPKDASAGERYAVIWAQDASQPRQTGNIKMVNRVGLRIYLDVGPGGEPPSDFQIVDLAATRTAGGPAEVVADVHNTGGRALDMAGSVSLTNGPGSLSAGPFLAKLDTTLGINDTERVTVPMDGHLPAGPWTVHLTLASGLVQHDATATLTFPDAVGIGPLAKPQADSSNLTTGRLGLGVTLGVLGLVAVIAFLYRRLRR